MTQIPVGLQLYTLRTETATDFLGTLRRVAALGYQGVEFAGYGGLPAADVRAVVDELGLVPFSGHVGIELLEDDLQGTLDYQAALGLSYVVVPWMPEARRRSADGWKEVAVALNAIGEACQARGMTLCYHNHDFEFQTFDGVTGFDILYGESDPRLVQAELDLYWVKKAGLDPAAMVSRMAGRAPLLHIKDMVTEPEVTFAEFGEGIIDWDAVFAVAPAAGAQWYIVEQDVCRRPCMESIAISIENLRKRGMV